MSGAGSSTSAEGGGKAPAASWGGNIGAIVNFLQSKGLNDYAIAGILGNLKVESGLNTDAANANEGAIGLAQWEGGRRQALDAYAAAHGGRETDLNIQLGYLWHELTTGYSGVLAQLQHATSATEAATIWDQQYEVSAGTTRSQRISNANAYLSSGFNSIGGDTATGSGGGGGSDLGGTGAGAPLTAADFEQTDGLKNLFNTVPELRHLMQQAVAGDWSSIKFQDAVENSAWYKTHGDTARAVIMTQANDPATYQRDLTTTEQSIQKLAENLGVPLGAGRMQQIAEYAMLTGNDKQSSWLTDQLFYGRDWSKVGSIDNLQGGMANQAQAIQKLGSDYGYQWTPAQVARYSQNILDGTTTLDTYKADLQKWAKSTFPALAQQIDAGQTVRDLASPYIQSMSNILEVDPQSINMFDPTIRKALQGSQDPKTQQHTSTPLWQFEQTLRQDPRWQYTQNAKDTTSKALVQLGATFGFGPQG